MLKHLPYEYLITLDTSILVRMLNCVSYSFSLDDDTYYAIHDILHLRYIEDHFEELLEIELLSHGGFYEE